MIILGYIILSLIVVILLIIIISYIWILRTTYNVKKRGDNFMKDKGLEIINKKIDKFIK
jgi:hypothetical protein